MATARLVNDPLVPPVPMPPPQAFRVPGNNGRRVSLDARHLKDPEFDLEELLADLPLDTDLEFEEAVDGLSDDADLPMQRAAPAPG